MDSNKVVSLAVAVGFGLIVLWLIVWPQAQVVMTERDVLEDERERLENLEFDLMLAEAAVAYINTLDEEEVERLHLAIPDEENAPDLVYLVDTIVSDSRDDDDDGFIFAGMTANVLETQDETVEHVPYAGTLTISINIEDGTYSSLKAFIRNLERSSRIFSVESISIQEGNDGFNFNVDAAAHYYDPSLAPRNLDFNGGNVNPGDIEYMDEGL